MNQKQIRERLALFDIHYLRKQTINVSNSRYFYVPSPQTVSAQIFQFPKEECAVFTSGKRPYEYHHLFSVKGKPRVCDHHFYNQEATISFADFHLCCHTQLFGDAVIRVEKRVICDDMEADIRYQINSSDPTIEKMVYDICQGNGDARVLMDFIREKCAGFMMI